MKVSPLELLMRRKLVVGGGALLVIAVVVAAALSRFSQQRRLQRRMLSLARIGATLLEDAEASDFQPDRNSTATEYERAQEAVIRFHRWARAVTRETRVIAAGVVDLDGTVLIASSPDAIAGSQMTMPIGRLDHQGVARVQLADADAAFAWWPIDRGPTRSAVVCAAVWASPEGWAASWQVGLVGAIGGVLAVLMLVVTTLACRDARRLIFDPLAVMASTCICPRAARSREFRGNLPVDRTDEIGRIAAGIEHLFDLLDHTGRQVTRLESSIDATVEQHTERINRMLLSAKRDAQCDALTGLANRRFIEEQLDKVFIERRSTGGHLGVVMLDLDNFKPLNDTEGHAAGDRVLRFVGELLNSTLRESDVAVRYGGDEFALILSDVTTEHAGSIAERICRMFAGNVAAWGLATKVSMSAGVATTHDVNVETGLDLLVRADEALYASKRSGKNKVEHAVAR